MRDYNGYLKPKLELFSLDAWTVAATIIRNLVLNWLVLVPLILFALMMPRLIIPFMGYGNFLFNSLGWTWLPSATLYLSYGLFSLAVFNTMRYLPGIGNTPHTQGDFLRYVLAPLVVSYILQCAQYTWTTQRTTLWREVSQRLLDGYAGWAGFLLICVAFRNPKRCWTLLFEPITWVALPLVGAGVGAISWFLLTRIYESDSVGLSQYVALGPPLLLLGFALAGVLFVGLTSGVLKEEDREWLSRAGAFLTLFILSWTSLCSIVLVAAEFISLLPSEVKSLATLLQTLTALSGLASGLAVYIRGTSKRAPRTRAWAAGIALKLVAPAFLILISLQLTVLTDYLAAGTGLIPGVKPWEHAQIVESSSLGANIVLAAGFLLLGLITARFIDINVFSRNSMYRNRLIRAYLGASNPKRNASLFTGFAENDNLRMRDIDTAHKPFHVLNLTLNLVAGERLAWQQLKADSFIVSPMHCGSSGLGYRPSAEYAEGIALGTAMSISGAAASPNMGYYSSPVMGFIMTLFNARLGAWLGNPGVHGEKTWRQPGPRSAVASLVREACGLTNDRSKYVYLSDGGHFENLGLYEMVARRCRHILVLDSGADPSFTYEDLGNALRKIRTDMNIPIGFEDALARPLQNRKKRCAIARIGYSKVDGECEDGYLIYVKPMYLGNEPPDVQSYHSEQPTFPHQTTTDPWFDESQTESYRMLGLCTMGEVCQHLEGTTLEHVCEAAERYIRSGGETALTAGVGVS